MFLVGLCGFSKATDLRLLIPKVGNSIISSPKIINNLDSMIFDLSTATLTATYIDIPVFIKISGTDTIRSFDYSLQFNLAKLTFSATIDINPDPNFQTSSFYNPNSLFLGYGSASFPGTPTLPPIFFQNLTKLTKIRFLLTTPCAAITAADITNVLSIINGRVCGNRVTNLNFTQFIPVASFNTGPTCSNSGIQFANTSTVQTGTVTASQWNFSTSGISSQPNPVASFTATGLASATLVVTTSNGCKNTFTNSFNVSPPPVSIFSYSYNCVKDSVFFTNASTVPVGTIAGALWNFGDQSAPSTVLNAVHNYSASGVYTVSLIAISNVSCTAISTLQVLLNAKVSANFTNSSVNKCIGTLINFVDATTYTVSTIIGWNWNFGDGGTSIMQNPSYTYTTPGSYPVTLTSAGADGCNGTITQTLNIFGPPVVQFTVANTTACALTPVTFTDLSTTPTGSSYKWNFGDGNTSILKDPTNFYSFAGAYPVKLIVTNPAGCVDSLTKNAYLNIDPAPASIFSLTSKCIFININFKNNSTISAGSIISYAWSFGDGNTSTLQNPFNTYSTAGNYTVTLLSTSNLGCKGTSTQIVNLSAKPLVDFEYTSGAINCSGQTLSFRNLSSSPIGSNYFWVFGDNGTSFLQNPVYTYSTAGSFSYNVKLTVINPGGCSDSTSKPYNVSLPFPAVALYSDSIIANAIVSFTNQSLNFKRVSWDFGDFQKSESENPLHTFPGAGTYKICLTSYNAIDCPNTFCKSLYVGLSNIVAVPAAFTPNQDGFNDVLRVRGGPLVDMDFRIFNQWGNEVFSSPEQSEGWDGSFRGDPQPVGSYEYILTGKTIDKKNIRLYGIVNLIR